MTLRGWLVAGTALACIAGQASARDFTRKPDFIQGTPITTHYDGVSNDLLTAGLVANGLQSATPPSLGNPPTAEDLRKLAIYANYRAIVDTTTGGGYGVLYGPGVDVDGRANSRAGMIAGDETIAFAIENRGRINLTLMVQVPDTYSPTHGCIVTAPSSGSRGIYGAVATAGEWGLKHGCAVAYTDKGTGAGFDDLQNSRTNLLRGELADIKEAGSNAEFVTSLSPEQRAAYSAAFPSRFAFKHAFSQQNPEGDWGRDVLQSVQFAFYVLNAKFPGAAIGKRNTIVIASSISNGGGASLRAIEQDDEHLIDGAAVGEPNVNPGPLVPFTIRQGGNPPFTAHRAPLIDYATFQNVFEGCAVGSLTGAPFADRLPPFADRCKALHDAGLLVASSPTNQATEAQAKLASFGFLTDQNFTEPLMWFAYVPQAIAVTYANAYGRFSPTDNLCGISFAATDPKTGAVIALAADAEAKLFGTSNGIPPTGGVNLVNNSVGKEDRVSTPDQDLPAALCLRSLATGTDVRTGKKLSGENAKRVRAGALEVAATGDLHRLPVIIVEGRSDDILPPNLVDRAYVALNAQRERHGSQLRYYEVTNANHLDNIVGLPGFSAKLVPLQKYFIEAMDLMYAHLRNGTPLPPSQVVHTTPRGTNGGAVSPITAANVPPIQADPGANAIVYRNRVLTVPE